MRGQAQAQKPGRILSQRRRTGFRLLAESCSSVAGFLQVSLLISEPEQRFADSGER